TRPLTALVHEQRIGPELQSGASPLPFRGGGWGRGRSRRVTMSLTNSRWLIGRTPVSRRRLLALGASGGVAAFLAACGSSSKDEKGSTSAGTAARQAAVAAPTVVPGRYTIAPKTG